MSSSDIRTLIPNINHMRLFQFESQCILVDPIAVVQDPLSFRTTRPMFVADAWRVISYDVAPYLWETFSLQQLKDMTDKGWCEMTPPNGLALLVDLQQKQDSVCDHVPGLACDSRDTCKEHGCKRVYAQPDLKTQTSPYRPSFADLEMATLEHVKLLDPSPVSCPVRLTLEFPQPAWNTVQELQKRLKFESPHLVVSAGLMALDEALDKEDRAVMGLSYRNLALLATLGQVGLFGVGIVVWILRYRISPNLTEWVSYVMFFACIAIFIIISMQKYLEKQNSTKKENST